MALLTVLVQLTTLTKTEGRDVQVQATTHRQHQQDSRAMAIRMPTGDDLLLRGHWAAMRSTLTKGSTSPEVRLEISMEAIVEVVMQTSLLGG